MCNQDDAELVSITSQAENDYVLSQIAACELMSKH